MKLLIMLVSIISSITCFATEKIVVSNNGTGWGNSANWSPSGVPVNGDEVIIPAGKTISVKGSFYAGTTNLTIKVAGTLDFDPSGKLDLNSLSNLQLLSPSARITSAGTSSELVIIGGITKYNGNLDNTVYGPAYASASTGSSPGGFSAGALPVRLTGFSATEQNGGVNILWTISELEGDISFIAERSSDQLNWFSIGTLNAVSGLESYNLFDHNPTADKNYYRLRIVEANRPDKYSPVVLVHNRWLGIKIYPNPANTYINLSLSIPGSQEFTIELRNSTALLLVQQQLHSNTQSKIDVSHLPNGIYFISVRNNSGILKQLSIVVQ